MTEKEFKNITSKFCEVKPIIEEHEQNIKSINKSRKKLRTKLQKYSYLRILVGTELAGNNLVNSIVSLFKELNIGRIENVDKKYLDEDIRLWMDNLLIIMEVTGIDKQNPKNAKAHQISQHIPIRQKQFPDKKVFGVFIVNHDNEKYFKNRNKRPFSDKLIEVAKSHNYTLMTTVDLLNAFKLIKMDKMKPVELVRLLCSTGRFIIPDRSPSNSPDHL